MTLRRIVMLAAAVAGGSALLAGCSTTDDREVTYRITSSAPIGEVSFYTYDGPDGGLVLTEQTAEQRWSKRVAAGSAPRVSARAPKRGEITCEILDAADSVIARKSARDSREVVCERP